MNESFPARANRYWPHAPAIIGASVLIGMAIYLCVRQDNEWEHVFVPAAQRLASGDDIYQGNIGYLYPPFMAWATLPFLNLSHFAGRFTFVALNLACLVFAMLGAWNLAGGAALQGSRKWLAALLGFSCGIFYILNCLVHQQTDMFIAALLVGGCLALAQGRSLLAATGFGLAAAMKCTALLWVPYLIWRRRPIAAGWLLAVALGVNLLPDLVNQPPSGGTWIGTFATRYLQPLTSRDHIPGSWASDIVYNQSVSGAVQRWTTTIPQWSSDDCTVGPSGAAVSPTTLRAGVLGSEMLLLVLTLVTAGRPFRIGSNDGRDALEFGIVLLLMLLLSPMSSMAHFGTLIVPGCVLAVRAIRDRDRMLLVLVSMAVGAALISNKDLLGGRLYTVALWSGCVTWNTFFLLIGSWRALWIDNRKAQESGPVVALQRAA